MTPQNPHAHRYLLPLTVAFTLLLALLLAGCLLAPIAGTPDSAASTIPVPAPSITSVGEGVNLALVGLYQSDVITRSGFGPWTEVMTLTMSLFADGTFEQLYGSAGDWGTSIEPRNKILAAGTWYGDGDTNVLLDDRGTVERFLTIGADALVLSLPTTWFGVTIDSWVLLKRSNTPEPLYACLVKQVLTAARNAAMHAPDPSLAGVYTARPQFVQEIGTVAGLLTLSADGWAEHAITSEGDPNVFPLEFGIWSANDASEPLVTLSLIARHSGIFTHAERTYIWNGTSLFYLGNQTGSAQALPLTRTDDTPAMQRAALREFTMSNPPAFPPCRWEAE